MHNDLIYRIIAARDQSLLENNSNIKPIPFQCFNGIKSSKLNSQWINIE